MTAQCHCMIFGWNGRAAPRVSYCCDKVTTSQGRIVVPSLYQSSGATIAFLNLQPAESYLGNAIAKYY